MFEDATFHSSNILPNQAPKWMLLTCAVNLTVVTALIVLPLIYPQALPADFLQSILYTPPAEPVAVRQHILVQPPAQSAPSILNPYAVPLITPRPIYTGPVDPPPGTPGDLLSGADGVSGTTNLSPNIFQQTKPTVVKPDAPHRMAISTGVSEGMILSKTNPAYPVIARTAGISGKVVLAATISTTGHIENLSILSGPPMLRQAAIDAVKTWRYRPYLLNNQPVEVETTINIVFSLGNR
jgi:protein TonB